MVPDLVDGVLEDLRILAGDLDVADLDVLDILVELHSLWVFEWKMTLLWVDVLAQAQGRALVLRNQIHLL